jgi:hypothetical protein
MFSDNNRLQHLLHNIELLLPGHCIVHHKVVFIMVLNTPCHLTTSTTKQFYHMAYNAVNIYGTIYYPSTLLTLYLKQHFFAGHFRIEIERDLIAIFPGFVEIAT